MSQNLQAALSEFDAEDKTPRLVAAVCQAVPATPDYRHARDLRTLMQYLRVDPSPANLNKVVALAREERVSDALWMASVLDTGDKGYSVLTGASSAMKLFLGGRRLDFDQAQRNDAVLKALGLAYMVHKAFPGSVTEKVRAFTESESGQMLTAWYAGIEIALPFADNLATGAAGFVERLIDGGLAAQAGRLAGLAGERSMEGVRETLTGLTGALQNGVNRAKDRAPALADAASRWLPKAAVAADVTTGLAAQAVDLMPAYRLLGARLAAEATIRRALE